MTKEEAIKAFCTKLEHNAHLVVDLCDAIEAVLKSPLASAYVCSSTAPKLQDFTAGGVECILRQMMSLKQDLVKEADKEKK